MEKNKLKRLDISKSKYRTRVDHKYYYKFSDLFTTALEEADSEMTKSRLKLQ